MLARLGHSPTVTLTIAVTSGKKIPSTDIYQEAANVSQSKARGGSTRLGKGHPFSRGSLVPPSPVPATDAFPLHRTTGSACY